MACNVQDWSLKDLTDALNNRHIDKKRIAVPMFQRGTRWQPSQEEKFIDSLKSGFPVGTMLFYETIEDNQSVYLLVDGLQRGNTIRKFITKPTTFISSETISDEICSKLLLAMDEEPSVLGIEKARTILTEFIKAQQSYNFQCYNPAKELLNGFGKATDCSLYDKVIPLLEAYFKDRQDRYTQIAQTIIPVVVYQGDATNLDEIFKRINSQGTPLDQYEVYAAAWPSKRIYHTENADIVDAVIQKYDSMEAGDFEIYGYDSTKIKKEKNLTAFEYLFGLSKVLTQKVDILRFIKQGEIPDEVNPLGFELVNACLNDSNKIPELYKRLADITDINQFEKALKNAIKFVQEAVALITRFKGNNRRKDKIFHSKFQIMSMISTTFKEMYGSGDYSKVADDWSSKKGEIARNLRQYYVYDILTNFWSEGGTGKIYAVAKPNRYRSAIASRSWNSALNGYFDRTMQRVECKKVPNPGNEEYVFLNCIYLHTFSAIDQLSADKFDIEHIAPKDQLKKLIAGCDGEGLAISSIANLCYLPEAANRAKGSKTLYQDKVYLKGVNLEEIEAKFSFTKEDDLDWMDVGYKTKKDFPVLKEWYEDFCSDRFKVLKQKFCEAMGIEIVEDATESVELTTDMVADPKKAKLSGGARPVEKAIERLQALHPELGLAKKTARACIDANGVGYYFVHSKAYKKGDDHLYWYGYRREPLSVLEGCSKIVLCYVLADEGRIVMLPQDEIEARTGVGGLNRSPHEDGSSHWHIKFVRDGADSVTWLAGPEGTGEKIVLNNII